MKKIILTEQQVKRLMEGAVEEQVPAIRATEYSLNDGRYHQKCRLDFNYYGGKASPVLYKGSEIDDIFEIEIDVSFMIDIEHETYGIKGIFVHDVRGPEKVETEIRYYPVNGETDRWGDVRPIDEPITFNLNWKRAKIDTYARIEHIGIEDHVDVRIVSDGNDGLIATDIEVSSKILKEE